MADDGIRNPILALLLLARRLFPYLVFFAGAVIGSTAVIRVCRAEMQQERLHELAWLGVSLLLYWLAYGLLDRNERSWKLYQAAGAGITASLGVTLAVIAIPDAQYCITHAGDPIAFEQSAPWFTTGVALTIWGLALLFNNGGACFLWQTAVLPGAFFAFWWWKEQAALALHDNQVTFVIISSVYFGLSMAVLLLIAQLVHKRIQTRDSEMVRREWDVPRSFSSKYHELFARGRLCELFEVPCEQPCPLATSIVAKYQKRRIQYRLYPDILEPFEKAYAILVTPQRRELCKVAHEILAIKEKQLGPELYHDMEIYLWRKLWERLQDGEYMGDPQKALRDKVQLLKDISPRAER